MVEWALEDHEDLLESAVSANRPIPVLLVIKAILASPVGLVNADKRVTQANQVPLVVPVALAHLVLAVMMKVIEPFRHALLTSTPSTHKETLPQGIAHTMDM